MCYSGMCQLHSHDSSAYFLLLIGIPQIKAQLFECIPSIEWMASGEGRTIDGQTPHGKQLNYYCWRLSIKTIGLRSYDGAGEGTISSKPSQSTSSG